MLYSKEEIEEMRQGVSKEAPFLDDIIKDAWNHKDLKEFYNHDIYVKTIINTLTSPQCRVFYGHLYEAIRNCIILGNKEIYDHYHPSDESTTMKKTMEDLERQQRLKFLENYDDESWFK